LEFIQIDVKTGPLRLGEDATLHGQPLDLVDQDHAQEARVAIPDRASGEIGEDHGSGL